MAVILVEYTLWSKFGTSYNDCIKDSNTLKYFVLLKHIHSWIESTGGSQFKPSDKTGTLVPLQHKDPDTTQK